jgi:hypothetical protein
MKFFERSEFPYMPDRDFDAFKESYERIGSLSVLDKAEIYKLIKKIDDDYKEHPETKLFGNTQEEKKVVGNEMSGKYLQKRSESPSYDFQAAFRDKRKSYDIGNMSYSDFENDDRLKRTKSVMGNDPSQMMNTQPPSSENIREGDVLSTSTFSGFYGNVLGSVYTKAKDFVENTFRTPEEFTEVKATSPVKVTAPVKAFVPKQQRLKLMKKQVNSFNVPYVTGNYTNASKPYPAPVPIPDPTQPTSVPASSTAQSPAISSWFGPTSSPTSSPAPSPASSPTSSPAPSPASSPAPSPASSPAPSPTKPTNVPTPPSMPKSMPTPPPFQDPVIPSPENLPGDANIFIPGDKEPVPVVTEPVLPMPINQDTFKKGTPGVIDKQSALAGFLKAMTGNVVQAGIQSGFSMAGADTYAPIGAMAAALFGEAYKYQFPNTYSEGYGSRFARNLRYKSINSALTDGENYIGMGLDPVTLNQITRLKGFKFKPAETKRRRDLLYKDAQNFLLAASIPV